MIASEPDVRKLISYYIIMNCYGTFVLSKNLVYLVCPAIRDH